MSVSRLSRQARLAVYVRLKDPIGGFNPLMQAICAEEGVTAVPINFEPKSPNFFFAQFEKVDDLLKSGTPMKYPVMTIYTTSSGNANIQKFNKFSGLIAVGVDYWVSWKQARALSDFEIWGDLFEEVVVDVMNRENNQTFGGSLVYNGTIAGSRKPVTLEGENWQQKFTVKLLFQVHTL